MEYRIGEVAAAVGVETHVLRHWEDVGVLVPARNGGGQRVYGQEAVTRARIIRRCQRAGLSLAEIRSLAPADSPDRIEIIAERRAALSDTIAQLRGAVGYLDHLTRCTHPLADDCPECSEFAHGSARTS